MVWSKQMHLIEKWADERRNWRCPNLAHLTARFAILTRYLRSSAWSLYPRPLRPAAPGEPAVQTRDRRQLEALSSENQSVRSRPKCCRKLFEEMKHGDETTEAALLVLSVISSMIMSAGFMRIFGIVVCNFHPPNVYATAQ